MAELKGFMKLMSKRIKRKKEQEAEAKGRPSWVEKLSSSDRRRWKAVSDANKKQKK